VAAFCVEVEGAWCGGVVVSYGSRGMLLLHRVTFGDAAVGESHRWYFVVPVVGVVVCYCHHPKEGCVLMGLRMIVGGGW